MHFSNYILIYKLFKSFEFTGEKVTMQSISSEQKCLE